MSRFVSIPVLAVFLAGSQFAAPVLAAPSPAPSALASDAAATNRDAGTIDGVVTGVDYTPGKSKMIVKAGTQSYTFAVLPGTNVQGPSHDFTVDVKVGSHVSVSASKSGSAYTAQIVRVVAAHAAH